MAERFSLGMLLAVVTVAAVVCAVLTWSTGIGILVAGATALAGVSLRAVVKRRGRFGHRLTGRQKAAVFGGALATLGVLTFVGVLIAVYVLPHVTGGGPTDLMIARGVLGAFAVMPFVALAYGEAVIWYLRKREAGQEKK